MHKIKLNIINIEGGGAHILINCKIDGEKAVLLIDTGASNTIFDINFPTFEKDSFSLIEDNVTSSGFNSTIDELYSGKGISLSVSRFKITLHNSILTSLDYINNIYSTLNIPKISGIIGSDFLINQKAIIDFPQKLLFLKKSY